MLQKVFMDHLQRTVKIVVPPRRIISLCPSITETVLALNPPGQVVGRTRYCIHPEETVKSITAVGGTKKVDFDLIDQLQPDLIIAEKEENPKEVVETLEKKYPVYVVNVENMDDALKMITDLGSILGCMETATQMTEVVSSKWKALLRPSKTYRVAYLIWRKPYMAVSSDTFIHCVLEGLGFDNVFSYYPGRYPEINVEDLKNQNPDFIFLSSEPFPFKETHIKELKDQYEAASSVLVDGEMFSWYGVRMLEATHYFSWLMKVLEGKIQA